MVKNIFWIFFVIAVVINLNAIPICTQGTLILMILERVIFMHEKVYANQLRISKVPLHLAFGIAN